MSPDPKECRSVVKLYHDNEPGYLRRGIHHEGGLSLDEIRELADEKTDDVWNPLKVKETYSWSKARECYV